MNDLLKNILLDLRVETLDEFDRNFLRKAFFDRPWPDRKKETGHGTLLVVTGRLHRSVRYSNERAFLKVSQLCKCRRPCTTSTIACPTKATSTLIPPASSNRFANSREFRIFEFYNR